MKRLLLRILGVCLFGFMTVPAFACGLYSIVKQDYPENVVAYLGISDTRLLGFKPDIGFTVLGVIDLLVGAACLVAALALTIWPDKVDKELTRVWRAVARPVRRWRGRG